ncbi:putative dehydrogenase [Amaricoccus macauensis]|uniref:Putative dehydrogenase n=1 Tax=Amaricoccus macauensis TaxID=57001 RepID=A0A840SUQ1_9RHOB|nr:putative dehydrogenase [Amaricoccus macauensis]
MKLALFGVGHWHAGMHAAAARVADAEIVAAWDPASERATEFASAHRCPAVETIDEALALRPDLAVVMGRPAEMMALAGRFVGEQLPVLVEKPVGVSGAVLRPLAEAAERAGAFVAVALAHRVGPLPGEVRVLGQAGRLGALSHSRFCLINGPPERYVKDGCGWVLDAAVSGGGALRNLGLHGVDAFLGLAGEQDVAVEHVTFGRPLQGTPVEDYALVVLRAADGAMGIVEAGYTFASMTGGSFEWRVSAKNATLIDTGDRLRVATLDDGETRELAATPLGRRYDALMADTIDRVRSRRRPVVSLMDHWRAMDLIDRCYAGGG